MVIEWLKFKLAPESREKFIELDKEIWTSFLSEQPGFLSKEIWLDPNNLDEIIAVVHWQTLEQWKSIPVQSLVQNDLKFRQALSPVQYIISESKGYQIRKFSG